VSNSQPDKRPPPKKPLVRITRQDSAKGQIEAAILLWFNDQDVSAIHTLAVAAQGLLTALCRDMHKEPPELVTRINRQPKGFQEQTRNPQNFFKHGKHKQPYKDVVSYMPSMAEIILIDDIAVYERLFRVRTQMMSIYAIRFSLTNPETLPMKISIKGLDIEDLRQLPRRQFLEKVLPFVSGVRHIKSP
jgi:hypothetical protein